MEELDQVTRAAQRAADELIRQAIAAVARSCSDKGAAAPLFSEARQTMRRAMGHL